MDDINLVIMSGVIVGTPEIKTIGKKETQVCTARIKSTRSFVYNGEKKESSCTRNLKAFGKVGEKLSQLRGGDRAMIQGTQETESWPDKNDATKKVFRDIIKLSEISADIDFTQSEYAPRNAAPRHEQAPTTPPSSQENPDDNLPF